MDTKQYPVTHSDDEWRRLLTPEQYRVLRGHGTEAPGSCALNYEKRHGTFEFGARGVRVLQRHLAERHQPVRRGRAEFQHRVVDGLGERDRLRRRHAVAEEDRGR